jgi:O-antigen ligase
MGSRSNPQESSSNAAQRLFFVLLGSMAIYLSIRHRSWAIQDIALWGAFLCALCHFSKASRAWRNPAGWATLAVVAYTVIQIPMGADPAGAGRAILKRADLTAFALAIPFLFGTRPRIQQALLSAALAISTVLCWDLARLIGLFGTEVISKARWLAPFTLNHPNTASMGAVLSIIVLGYSAGAFRKTFPLALISIVALGIDLTYLTVVASRGPQLALIGSVAAAVFLAVGRRMKLAVLAAVVICAVLLPMANPRFQHVFSHAALQDRDKAWTHTLKLSAERPWFGYGYGDAVFMKAYHTSNPPASAHHFYHPHLYWLNILFAQGWIGLVLHAAMWSLLVVRLARRVVRPDFNRRGLAMTVLALVLCLQLYGLLDVPTNIVALAMQWIIPIALAVTWNDEHDKQ